MPQQPRGLKHRRILNGGRNVVVQRFDLRPNIAHREYFARDAIGARNRRRIRPGVILGSDRKHRPHAVDQLLVIAVAMISRRRRWRLMRFAKRFCTGVGK